MRWIPAAGGGAPAVRTWIRPGSGRPVRSGASASMLRTTGPPHMWVAEMAAASKRRSQTLTSSAAAMPQGKLHPLAWNTVSVHRDLGFFGTDQSMGESTMTRKRSRWRQWTTPSGRRWCLKLEHHCSTQPNVNV
ncbi:hypothetical protein MUK42_34673 [Musa troglodytarum]|uniref:Uncharacterized protein n=1 Tax=Musa troglodytarum TaxID=320322 RepID=A0A9E7GNT5_9LILI|nr:hypothetical protein MUK42_34673 [Musa troglodytarum]